MAARTAVVVGTAGAVRNRQENKQQEKYDAAQAQQAQATAAPPPAPAAAPAAPAQDDLISQIEKLADMKSRGLLTDEEYAAAKARLLSS